MAYEFNGQSPAGRPGASELHDLLSPCLMISELGVRASITDISRHRATRDAVASARGSWPLLVGFEQDAVHNYGFESGHRTNLSGAEITMSVFEPSSMYVRCDPRHGKCMACCMMHRRDVAPKDMNAAVEAIKDLVIALDGSGSPKQEGFALVQKLALNLTSAYRTTSGAGGQGRADRHGSDR